MIDPLIFGRQYKVWLEEKYIGIATWTEDPNVGDAFLISVVTRSGELGYNVCLPDWWELIPEENERT